METKNQIEKTFRLFIEMQLKGAKVEETRPKKNAVITGGKQTSINLL